MKSPLVETRILLSCCVCGEENRIVVGTGEKTGSGKEKFMCHRGHAGWIIETSAENFHIWNWKKPPPTALDLVTLAYKSEWGKGTKVLMKGIISSFISSLDRNQFDDQTINRLCDEAEIGHIVGEEDDNEDEEEPF